MLLELNRRASFDRSCPANYVLATGLSRAAASADLKRIVDDPDSGITVRGSHSHKVWVVR